MTTLPILKNEFKQLLCRLRMPMTGPVAVAVSGGVDSMALCYLLACVVGATQVHALTVDHRLRHNSREEAEKVGEFLKQQLGVRSTLLTLQWPQNQQPTMATLETEARQARYAQLAQACQHLGTSCLWVGHHADDAHETLLFRLARASGVYGLAGLAYRAPWPYPCNSPVIYSKKSLPSLSILRPFLSIPKDRLIATCQHNHIHWFEDPTNQSSHHQRNVIRKTLKKLRSAPNSPLSSERLDQFVHHMLTHRANIDRQAKLYIQDKCHFDKQLGIYQIVADYLFFQLPRIIRHRILSLVYQQVRVSEHPPRLIHLEQIEKALKPSPREQYSPQTVAGLVLIRHVRKDTPIWNVVPQPLTAKEKQQHYPLLPTNTLSANNDMKHYYGVWHQRQQIYATCFNLPDSLSLKVRSFDVRKDTSTIIAQLNKLDVLNYTTIKQFIKLHPIIRSSQPVIVATTSISSTNTSNLSDKKEQLVGLPTIGISLVPWLDNVKTIHKTTNV